MTISQYELSQFTGTEHYYNHWLGIKLTDGVKYLAERAKAYWLIDAIASYHRKEPFQVWELKVLPSKEAVLTMVEDSDQPVLVKQDIPFTDFPLTGIKLYLIDSILLLPSEY